MTRKKARELAIQEWGEYGWAWTRNYRCYVGLYDPRTQVTDVRGQGITYEAACRDAGLPTEGAKV